ncbi:MAG: hypothetical protein Q7V57_03135 [Actinomycetota bacterium]|nr:hypothetical protein [Actinomycetota bacterium]
MQYSFRSTSFGMRQFPVGATESNDYGEHIMGVTVMTWLSRFAVAEWGADWARHGSMDLRFRSHLSAGLDLLIDVQTEAAEMTFAVTDAEGTVYSTGSAHRKGKVAAAAADTTYTRSHKVPNTHAALDGLVLTPVRCTFLADRDLEMTPGMADGGFWREHRWAHPAWVASAANAVFRENVEFESPTHWHHAGIETTFHAPVTDGAEVVLAGRVAQLFDTARNRFAVSATEATVNGEPVMSLRSTFVYRPLS